MTTLMPTPDIPDWANVQEVWLQWAKHPRKIMTDSVCENDWCDESYPCSQRREAQRALDDMGIDPYEIMRDFGLTGRKF